ncbi:MAG: helix-turn-helix domain-containing protein [Terriglobales bacterium]
MKKKQRQPAAVGPKEELEGLYRGHSTSIEGIGRWIKALRENAKPKLSQRALADHIGVDVGTVARWEIGRRNPSADHLIAIGNLFGYPDAKDAWINAGIDRRLLKGWEQLLPEKALRITHGLFPFAAGDLIAVEDRQIENGWDLLDELVAVRFRTYQAVEHPENGAPVAGIFL